MDEQHRRLRRIEARREAIRRTQPVWEERTTAANLRQVAARHPERPFLITDAGSWTYGEMQAWIARLGRGFMAAGVGRGDHVALLMANHAELVAVRFALSAIGAVSVPINTGLKSEELGYLLKQSDSKFLVVMDRFRDRDFLAMLDETAPGWEDGASAALPELKAVLTYSPEGHAPRIGVTSLAMLADRGEALPLMQFEQRMASVDPHDLVDIVYTSGTTGLPKGVMLTHDNVLRCSFTACLARAIEDGRRMLFSLPLYHNYAYVEGMLALIWAGGTMIMQDRFDPEQTMAAIETWRANEVLLVPTMTIAMIEHPRRDAYDFSSLTAVMSAAAAAPAALAAGICRIFGVDEITTAYGQTECSSSAAYKRPEDPIAALVTTVGRLKPRSVAGAPELDGRVAAYRIADPETGEIMPEGGEGELIVRGPEVMRGYYNKPEETAAVFRDDGWMRTGDLGRFTADGFIALTGRSKELYKCGAELVAPKEVEDLLTRHDAVSQAYVIGVPDPRMGEVGCAIIVPAPDAVFDETALRDYCRERLARYKVPQYVLAMRAEDLPMTATGKVQKFRLASLVQERFEKAI